jgi:hypothetical protein
VDALAAHRLTRLVTADVITQELRDRIVGWAYRRDGRLGWRGADVPLNGWSEYAEADPDAPKLATLLTCRWCASVYVGALVVTLRRVTPVCWGYLARALAASSAAALLAAIEED